MKDVALFFILLASSLYTLTCPTAHAQWVQTNVPLNTSVYSFTGWRSIIFAGTGTGVFFSVNGGIDWELAPDSQRQLGYWYGGVFYPASVYAVAVNDSFLIAATNVGIFRSTELDSPWQQVNNGLTNLDVQALAMTPLGGGSTIFAGTSGGGVFISTNNGSTWQPVNSGLRNPYVDVLAFVSDGAGGTNILAGTANVGGPGYRGGVFISS